MYDIIQDDVVLFLLESTICIPFYIISMYPFVPTLKPPIWRIAVAAVSCFTVLYLSLMAIGFGSDMTHPLLILYIFGFNLATIFTLLWFYSRANKWIILFNLFFTACYAGDIFYFVWILSRLMFPLLSSVHLSALAVSITLFLFITLYVLTFPLALYFQRHLVKPLTTETMPLPFMNKAWCLPCVFFVLFFFTQNMIMSNENTGLSYFEDLLIHISWTLGTFCSCGILLQTIKEWIVKHRYQEELQTTSLYLTMQRREYERLHDAIDTTRKIRHDMRQHMTLLQGLAQKKDLDGITAYIKDYLNISGIGESTILCDNFAINALAQFYYAQAKEAGIPIKIDLRLPKKLAIPESALASILGNMLENALEACYKQKDGQRFITVKGAILQDRMIALSCRNSFDSPVIFENDKFISTKRPGHQAGIGTSSMQSLAEQYHGVARFKHENNIFTASILLNIPVTHES